MNIDRAVLVVIDMQNGFVNDKSRHVVPVIADLIDQWEAAGGATIFTRYLNYQDSPFERIIKWSKLQESPETDIVEELTAHADRAAAIVDKKIYTLFTPDGTRLVEHGGWSDLVFCGIATESCVLKSAVDAFELNYTPWIVTDASASHAGSVAHDAGLLVAGRFIGPGQLVDTATLIRRIEGRPPTR